MKPLLWHCILLSFALASACSGGKDAPSASGAPGGVASLKVCQSVVRALDAEKKCAGRLQRTLESLPEQLSKTAPLDAQARESEERYCALLLGERVDELTRQGCSFPHTDEERGWIAAARTRLTAPPEIATVSEQDTLDSVANFRDSVCACRDVECSRKLANEVRLPTLSDEVAKKAAAKMLDEAHVCHRKLEQPERAMMK